MLSGQSPRRARKLLSCCRSSTAAKAPPSSMPRPAFPSSLCSAPRSFSPPPKREALVLRPPQQPVADILELIEGRVADAKLALLAFAFADDLNIEAQSLVQLRFGGPRVGILALQTLGLGGS